MMILTTALSACTDSEHAIEQRVNELYEQMTQEERIAQLRGLYMQEFFDENGKLDTAKCRKIIPNGIGHFSQFAFQYSADPTER